MATSAMSSYSDASSYTSSAPWLTMALLVAGVLRQVEGRSVQDARAPLYSSRPSPGCGKPVGFRRGEATLYSMDQTDPDLGEIEREYVMEVPFRAAENVPLPLLIFYHGQTGNALATARSFSYGELGEQHGFATVFPQGLADSEGISFCGTGWNTGSNGDTNTCTSAADLFSCCYKSCRAKGLCTGNFGQAKCSWSTCYDDVAFTADLIEEIGSKMCIDLNQVYASGVSNGGMATFEVVQRRPDLVAAVVPVFGLPLTGHLNVPKSAGNVPYLFLSGRQDTVVPIDGSLSSQGWYYATAVDAAKAFAGAHDCDTATRAVATPYDGGSINFACTEHTGCSGGRVITCLYDGGHSLPGGRIGEGITWWFLSQYMPQGVPSGAVSAV